MWSRRVGLAACLLVGMLMWAGQAQAGGRAPSAPLTTAPDLYVTVNVTVTNTQFILSKHAAPRGADARFVVHNVSNRTHIFALGNPKYATGKQTGFSVSVKPGQKKILILFLDIRGKVQYYPGLPADAHESGMKGDFDIGPCTHYESVTGVGEC